MSSDVGEADGVPAVGNQDKTSISVSAFLDKASSNMMMSAKNTRKNAKKIYAGVPDAGQFGALAIVWAKAPPQSPVQCMTTYVKMTPLD